MKFEVFGHGYCQDIILHECTAGFAKQLFELYLGDYDVHRAKSADGRDRDQLLSPHMFGWPLYRPRFGQHIWETFKL